MSTAIDKLRAAQERALAIRPKMGGFPVLAETLRQAGVRRNHWFLPAAMSLYLTDAGSVVQQGTPLVQGAVDVSPFNRKALIRALRVDQAGESSFPEFLKSTWQAGVIRYEVDFDARKVTYYGCDGDSYEETYPHIEI